MVSSPCPILGLQHRSIEGGDRWKARSREGWRSGKSRAAASSSGRKVLLLGAGDGHQLLLGARDGALQPCLGHHPPLILPSVRKASDSTSLKQCPLWLLHTLHSRAHPTKQNFGHFFYLLPLASRSAHLINVKISPKWSLKLCYMNFRLVHINPMHVRNTTMHCSRSSMWTDVIFSFWHYCHLIIQHCIA